MLATLPSRVTPRRAIAYGVTEAVIVTFRPILVLANSYKNHERCIAGRSVATDGRPGRWIRPIGASGQGELRPHEMRTADGYPIRVLDIIEVPLSGYADDAVHPEDWRVDAETLWRRSGKFDRRMAATLEEHPAELWLETLTHVDRACTGYVLSRPGHRSLYLIRPADFRVDLPARPARHDPTTPRRPRARFGYAGIEYEMNITDPVFLDRWCRGCPEPGEAARVVRPVFGDRCLLCVSLTPLFHGYHYKVVATVLEIE